MNKDTFNEIAKAGVLFLVLGIAVYALWNKTTESDKRLSQEIEYMKIQNRECTSTYQNLLLNQISQTTIVIQENTRVLQRLESDPLRGRR